MRRKILDYIHGPRPENRKEIRAWHLAVAAGLTLGSCIIYAADPGRSLGGGIIPVAAFTGAGGIVLGYLLCRVEQQVCDRYWSRRDADE